MTEILAHDIDGRPLRAGDRVVFTESAREPAVRGITVTVVGPDSMGCEGAVDTSYPLNKHGYKWLAAYGNELRRIDADHTPADHGFTELVENLKTGSLEPLEIE